MPFNDVFISYGRKESKDFARKLHDRLVADGYRVWFDQEDIPLGVDFQDQIDDGITNSQNFVYIIAPHAIDSPYCLKEIELAASYNKRIIPLLHVPPKSTEQENKIHPSIRRINWTPFAEEAQFEDSYKNFRGVLLHHEQYVNNHTEFLQKALKWKKHNFENSFLLVGEDRKEAEAWLKYEFQNELPPCTPIDLHCELITESKKNAYNLHSDVFFSAEDTDKSKIKVLRLALQRQGYTTWWDERDLKAGMKERNQIERGIELADNFVFLLSEESLQSEEKIKELEYASSLNKRIVPIVIGEVKKQNFPKVLEGENAVVWKGEKDLDEFLSEIHQDRDYLHQHTNVLVAALKWERQNYNQSILFRGYNLQEAENWLRIAEKRSRQVPTELQVRFVEESSQKGGTLPSEVFISYSRADGDFARHLNSELQIHGKTTWFDQESIAPSADFQEEILKGIKTSDNFLFVISERSLISPYCDAEIQYAQKLRKRFITILLEDTEKSLFPAPLTDIQWIDFRVSVREFHVAFSELLRSLDTDREHVSAHTRWAQTAEKWEQSGKVEELLLRGIEFEMANTWLRIAIDEKKSPQPVPLQSEFVEASQKAIFAYERRKKIAARRLRIMVFVMALLAIAAFGLAGWSLMLRKEANESRDLAQEQRKEAEQATIEAHKQKKIAEAKQSEAEAAQEEALKNYRIAENEKRRAERSSLLAKQKTKEAESNLTIANEKEEEAKRNADEATTQKNIAEKNANLAEERMSESQAITFIAKAREVERENPTLAMHLALAAEKILPENTKVQNTILNIYYKNNFYHPFADLESAVTSVTYSPDGRLIAVITQNSQVQIWNTFGEKERTLWGHEGPITSLAFDADSKFCMTGSLDKTVRIWSLEDGSNRIIGRHDGIVTGVAVAPDKNLIASVSADKSIRLWTYGGVRVPFLGKHDEPVTSVKFSPNGRFLLTGSADKTAILWKLSGRKKEKLESHHGTVTAITFSPDGKYIATGSDDRNIIIWDMNGEVHSFLSGHELSINDIEFSFDSKYIISASKDKTARLWALGGEELQLFKGHKEEVTSVAFSPDENFILSSSTDQSLKIWLVNTDAQQILKAVKPKLEAFDLSNQGYMALSKGDEKVYLLDDNAVDLRILDKHKYPVKQLSFSPGAGFLVSGDEKGNVYTWSVDGKALGSFETGESEITLLRVAPNGDRILIGSRDGKLNLWTLDGWVDIRFPELADVAVDADFSSDGRFLIAVINDGSTLIWNMAGELELRLPMQNGGATACTFSNLGTDFLLGYQNGLVRSWDIKGNPQKVFIGHSYRVRSISISQDNLTFASSSDDKTARLWDMNGNELQIYAGHKDMVKRVVFSTDKKTLLTVSDDNTIRRWNKSISFEEYEDDYGFGELPIADQLTYGLLEFDSLKRSSKIDKLIDGANYYLASAVSYNEDENLRFRQKSVILLGKAARIDSTNTALRQRLAGAYHSMVWGYLITKEFPRALASARLAFKESSSFKHLAVRLATALLYNDKWNEVKVLYLEWIAKDPTIKEDFLNEILRLENIGIYARYRRQAKEILK